MTSGFSVKSPRCLTRVPLDWQDWFFLFPDGFLQVRGRCWSLRHLTSPILLLPGLLGISGWACVVFESAKDWGEISMQELRQGPPSLNPSFSGFRTQFLATLAALNSELCLLGPVKSGYFLLTHYDVCKLGCVFRKRSVKCGSLRVCFPSFQNQILSISSLFLTWTSEPRRFFFFFNAYFVSSDYNHSTIAQ